MSEAAKIILTGKSRKVLLEELEKIKAWDSGHDYPIQVNVDVEGCKDKSFYRMDFIGKIEEAINNDLRGYIELHFPVRHKVVKSGGNDDLYIVNDPDSVHNEYEGPKKSRNKMSHLTPKKKKRK